MSHHPRNLVHKPDTYIHTHIYIPSYLTVLKKKNQYESISSISPHDTEASVFFAWAFLKRRALLYTTETLSPLLHFLIISICQRGILWGQLEKITSERMLLINLKLYVVYSERKFLNHIIIMFYLLIQSC